jgi:hypothetical protein
MRQYYPDRMQTVVTVNFFVKITVPHGGVGITRKSVINKGFFHSCCIHFRNQALCILNVEQMGIRNPSDSTVAIEKFEFGHHKTFQ